jgi:hypothetical protein
MRRRLEAQIVNGGPNRQARGTLNSAAIRDPRGASVSVARKTGRPEYASIRTAQFLGSDFARRTCCKPSRLVLVASHPFVAALLIGLKGVLNPKAQVSPVAASRFNHSLGQTSTKIWRSRCH